MGAPAPAHPHHALDVPHRRALAGGHPAAGRLLLEGRHPGRDVPARLRRHLHRGLHRGRPDRLLHVPAHGQDVLRHEPRRPGRRAARPRVAALDDRAAHPAGRAHRPAGPRSSGLPLGDSTILHWLEPIFLPAEELMGIHLPEYELLGIDGALILVSVGIGRPGHRPGHLALRLLPPAGPARDGGAAHRPQPPDALPVRGLAPASGGSTTSTTSSSTASAGPSPTRVMWFDVRVIDGIVNGTGARDPARG